MQTPNSYWYQIAQRITYKAEYLGKDGKFFLVVEGRITGSPTASHDETLWNNNLVVTTLDYLSRGSKFNTTKLLPSRFIFPW